MSYIFFKKSLNKINDKGSLFVLVIFHREDVQKRLSHKQLIIMREK